jgi:hypothetical protein
MAAKKAIGTGVRIMFVFILAVAAILITAPNLCTNHIPHWLMEMHDDD